MGIHPFNQPDVEAAKIEARKLTDEYEEKGELPPETPFYEEDGVKLFSGEEYAAELAGSVEDKSLEAYLEAHLLHLGENDYFAVLGYIEMNEENEMLLQAIREKVLESNPAATCLGFGPRFLHSTGQAYKGGPNSGVFLQITADDEADFAVPGQKYTFGVVKAAQARGDFQVLIDRGRRALRVHLGTDVKEGLRELIKLL
jgi:transaldolase/glucose-6-phosphate isomerase